MSLLKFKGMVCDCWWQVTVKSFVEKVLDGGLLLKDCHETIGRQANLICVCHYSLLS